MRHRSPDGVLTRGTGTTIRYIVRAVGGYSGGAGTTRLSGPRRLNPGCRGPRSAQSATPDDTDRASRGLRSRIRRDQRQLSGTCDFLRCARARRQLGWRCEDCVRLRGSGELGARAQQMASSAIRTMALGAGAPAHGRGHAFGGAAGGLHRRQPGTSQWVALDSVTARPTQRRCRAS